MKRILLLPVLLAVLTLSACAPGSRLGNLIEIATTTVRNPVDRVDIYRAKNVYAAGLELFVEYRTYCWARPYAVLMADPVARPVCEHRRAVVRVVQKRRPGVAQAIRTAESFIRDNPTINASSVMGAVWDAIDDFKNLIPLPPTR